MNLPPDMFRSQIHEAKKRLIRLVHEQQKTNQEIGDLRELIRANANFLPDAERNLELMFLELFKSPANITEAVRLAIFVASMYGKRTTPVDIKGMAESLGFDFTEYSNPMASIHTILKRMKETDPPAVDYDEKTDAYWFGEEMVGAAADLLDETFFNEVFKEVVAGFVAGTAKDLRTAVKSSLTKKVRAMQRNTE